MKQVLQSYRTGELWLAEVPAPAVGPRAVLVQTRHSLVSAGTERMIVELARLSLLGKARARPDLVKKVLAKIKTEGLSTTLTKVFAKLDTPISLGYSAAGTVVEVGAAAPGFQPGDHVACGGAGYATHAQFNAVPQTLCAKVPAGVTLEDAAFATLGAIAMQGVRQADVRVGERVAVVGLGLLGLLTVQILKAAGCAVVGVDLDADKCVLAVDLGAEQGVDPPAVADACAAVTGGRGADAVIITAAAQSNQPLELAAELCRAKGRVVVVGLVGMDVPRDPFYKKELDLRMSMSYGPGRYDPQYEEGGQDYPFAYVRWTEQRNMESFLYLVAQKKVTPSRLVTHRFPIDRALEAYELLEGKAPSPRKYLGILLDYAEAAAGGETPPPQLVRLRSAGTDKPIGAAFIGAGQFAKGVLIPALKAAGDVNLIAVCTATGMSAAETAKKHGFELATTDYRQVLADPRINAVFIATRHDSHAALAAAALAAGKNVLVEKPLCIREEDLETYSAALAAAGATPPCLMVGFNRRFSPHAEALRQAFRGRATPLVVNYRVNAGAISRDSWLQDPEVGGGRIVGEVCHFVDFCAAISGAVPTRVFAACVGGGDAKQVAEDSVVITLNYADGSLATIQYLAHGAAELGKERIEVCAGGVSAVTEDFRTTVFHGGKIPGVSGRQDKGFAGGIRAFLDAVRRGGDWPIPFQSLLSTTQVTFAIRQSLRTGASIAIGS